MKLPFQPVLAAASGEKTPLDLGEAGETAHAASGGSLVRTVVGLAIVLAVIFGLHWVLKQVKASREERADGSGLTPVATLPLGSNRSLHVVRAGREVLVVGSGEHGVTPVRAYSEAEARALGVLDEAVPTEPIEATPRRALPAPQQALAALRSWTVRG
jgi:flagellar protein FliO/FliZ